MYFVKDRKDGIYPSGLAPGGFLLTVLGRASHGVQRQQNEDSLVLDASSKHRTANHICSEIRPRAYVPAHCRFLPRGITITRDLCNDCPERQDQLSLLLFYLIFSAFVPVEL